MALRLPWVLLAAAASAYRLEVPFWTDDAGFCEPLPGLAPHNHRPSGLTPLTVFEGTTLVFKYSRYHDVWEHATAESLAACDFDTATMLADTSQGGGCTNDANLSCIRAASGFEWHSMDKVGQHFFSCSVHDHCPNGQRLEVTVLAKTAPVPTHPMQVVVPQWTDDAGYCKPIPGLAPTVHRPSGLRPITLLTGQSLLFRYSQHHDVWAHPTLEALQNCDYDSAVQLAGRSDGGGCADDLDQACLAASDGFALTPTQDEMYLSCGVHDHCQNGQRLVVTVLPAPCPHDEMTDGDGAADADEQHRRNSAILMIEGLAAANAVLLMLVSGVLVLLCCVLRAVRSTHLGQARHGGGGAIPSFNRLDFEMQPGAPKPEAV